MSDFNMLPMMFECSCGHPRSHVKVNISSMSELVLTWKCMKCGKDVISRIPFEKLIAEASVIPSPQMYLPAPLLNASDKSLLGEMNIKWEN